LINTGGNELFVIEHKNRQHCSRSGLWKCFSSSYDARTKELVDTSGKCLPVYCAPRLQDAQNSSAIKSQLHQRQQAHGMLHVKAGYNSQFTVAIETRVSSNPGFRRNREVLPAPCFNTTIMF